MAESLGDVRVRLGEFEAAGEAYRASRRRWPRERVEDAELMLKQALVPWRLGRYPQALRWLTRALNSIDGDERKAAVRQRASLFAGKGVVRQKQGHPLETIAWCRRAIEAADASGARRRSPRAYYMLDGRSPLWAGSTRPSTPSVHWRSSRNSTMSSDRR